MIFANISPCHTFLGVKRCWENLIEWFTRDLFNGVKSSCSMVWSVREDEMSMSELTRWRVKKIQVEIWRSCPIFSLHWPMCWVNCGQVAIKNRLVCHKDPHKLVLNARWWVICGPHVGWFVCQEIVDAPCFEWHPHFSWISLRSTIILKIRVEESFFSEMWSFVFLLLPELAFCQRENLKINRCDRE